MTGRNVGLSGAVYFYTNNIILFDRYCTFVVIICHKGSIAILLCLNIDEICYRRIENYGYLEYARHTGNER